VVIVSQILFILKHSNHTLHTCTHSLNAEMVVILWCVFGTSYLWLILGYQSTVFNSGWLSSVCICVYV